VSFKQRLERALVTVDARLNGESRQVTPGLFDEAPAFPRKRAHPDSAHAKQALLSLGCGIWETFEYAIRSELPLEDETAAYAVIAIREGSIKAVDRSRPEARAVLAAAYKVRREVHRLLGLLRFEPDEEGILSAYCEPDHDILELLAPAFLRRFGPEPFRIVDLRRGFALASRDGTIRHEPARTDRFGKEPGTGDSAQNDSSRDLWRTYYRATENPARSNPTLRIQFMPRRYWKHLTEMDDESREK